MKLYRWFSICSAHFEYNKDCVCCNVGTWTFMPTHYIGSLVFKLSPGFWRWWMNRGGSKAASNRFKNRFTDRDGNKNNPFPNL